jgi:hypothetical protein
VSEAVPVRDPVETARILERWLGARLGVASVAVSHLSIPKAGFSNETIPGVADVVYYEVLAGLQFALINSRMADLLISTGKMPESVASTFVTRVTAMTRRDLDRATAG